MNWDAIGAMGDNWCYSGIGDTLLFVRSDKDQLQGDGAC